MEMKMVVGGGAGLKYFMLLLRSPSLYKRLSTVSQTAFRVRSTADRLTGQDNVLASQLLVKQLKEDLKSCRNSLSDAREEYEVNQHQIRDHYTRKGLLYQDPKRDLSSLRAMHAEEQVLLEEEHRLHELVEKCRTSEREYFQSLCDAIQSSHEQERAYGDRAKHYTAIASLTSALLGFIGSYVFLRQQIRKRFVQFEDRLDSVEAKFNQQPTLSALGTVQETLDAQSKSLNLMHRRVQWLHREVVELSHEEAPMETDTSHINDLYPHQQQNAQLDERILYPVIFAGVLQFVYAVILR